MSAPDKVSKESRVVWVTHWVNHDYSPAREYGTVRVVTKGSLYALEPREVERLVQEGLKEAVAHDCLVVSGNVLASGLAVSHMLQRFGRVNFLSWNGFTKEYDFYSTTGEDIT